MKPFAQLMLYLNLFMAVVNVGVILSGRGDLITILIIGLNLYSAKLMHETVRKLG